MVESIDVPDELYNQLKALARPFVDKDPSDVIRHLIEIHAAKLNTNGEEALRDRFRYPVPSIDRRNPRARGARVDIDGHMIHALSVYDLFEKVLEYLWRIDVWSRVLEHVPYGTSQKRYLIANTPVHQRGNPFVVPVEYHGLYMEAHKSYKAAIDQLKRFLLRCGFTLTYVGE